MTEKEKKEKFLIAYKKHIGNLSDSLAESGISAKDYNKFLDEPRFKEEIEAVQLIKDDLVNSAFSGLIESGSERAIIEAKKMQKERSHGIDIQDIKVKAMIFFTKKSDTKGEILTEFCDWFKVAESTAESFYKKVKTENRLKSPLERKRQKDKEHSKRLDVRFDDNAIDELTMYRELIRIQLSIIEDAEYPGEKAKASSEVLNLTRRLDEIQERENRKVARSNEDVSTLMDAQLFGISIEEVKRLEFEYNGKKIEAKDAV